MTRRCCYCEVEFGIRPKKEDRVSHGICARHNLEMLAQVFGSVEEAQSYVAANSKKEDFCADMAQVFDG